MKVFISWSGELSKKVAEILKRKIPCIIQSVEVFYSSNDIEKGENWDAKLVSELADSNFGITCLTQENVSAPWIHFESGAISKALESRVSALMIGINPSNIQGPLNRFQATKIEKDDFLLLMTSINNVIETPLREDVLKETFNMVWPSLEREIKEVVSFEKPITNQPKQKLAQENNSAIEEILALLRKQNTILSSPAQLIPPDYLMPLLEDSSRKNLIRTRGKPSYYQLNEKAIFLLVKWAENSYYICKDIPEEFRGFVKSFEFDRLYFLLISYLEHADEETCSMGFRESMIHKLNSFRGSDQLSLRDIG